MVYLDEEELISIIKEYPNLYDPAHPRYHDHLCTTKTWSEIGKMLLSTGQDCHRRWRSLRECFRKAINNREKKLGKTGKPSRPWRFESQMKFLLPYLKNLDSTISLEGLDQQCSENDLQNSELLDVADQDQCPDFMSVDVTSNVNATLCVKEEEHVSDSYTAPPLEVHEVEDSSSNDGSMVWSNEDAVKPQKMSLKIKRKGISVGKTSHKALKKRECSTPAADFEEYIDLKPTIVTTTSNWQPSFLENTSTPSIKVDHLTKYFQSVEETVRTLPPIMQVKIKSQISRIVHEAEAEALKIQGQNQFPDS